MSRTHNRQPMVHRMARIEGHVHAVREMLISDRDCPEILIQLAAIRSALDGVARLVFEDHMDSCIVDAVETLSDPQFIPYRQPQRPFFTILERPNDAGNVAARSSVPHDRRSEDNPSGQGHFGRLTPAAVVCAAILLSVSDRVDRLSGWRDSSDWRDMLSEMRLSSTYHSP